MQSMLTSCGLHSNSSRRWEFDRVIRKICSNGVRFRQVFMVRTLRKREHLHVAMLHFLIKDYGERNALLNFNSQVTAEASKIA